jgi:hypothetical protein
MRENVVAVTRIPHKVVSARRCSFSLLFLFGAKILTKEKDKEERERSAG